MGTHAELDNLDLNGLTEAFHGPSPDGPEYACSYYSEVTTRLRQLGAPGVAFLWSEVRGADEDHLRALIFALSMRPDLVAPAGQLGPDEQANLRQLLVDLCRDARSLVVAEAVEGLSGLGDRDAKDTVMNLKSHVSPFVRGSVLRYAGRLFGDESLPLLIESLQDTDYMVRESAVDQLEEAGADSADQLVPLLLPLLDDPHIDVRLAARTAIENLQRR